MAAEVASGPIDDFDYDVAILFSDILYPLELFDLDLSYNPGPTFTDYLKPSDIKKNIDNGMVEEHLNFQSDAIKLTKEALSNGDKILSENYYHHADHFIRISEKQNTINSDEKVENYQDTNITEKKSI